MQQIHTIALRGSSYQYSQFSDGNTTTEMISDLSTIKHSVKRRTWFWTQAADSRVCVLTRDPVLLPHASLWRPKQMPKLLSNSLVEERREGGQRLANEEKVSVLWLWASISRQPSRGWKASRAEDREPQMRKSRHRMAPLGSSKMHWGLNHLSPKTKPNP